MKPRARSRGGRVRRAAKWAGLVLCVLIACGWAVSMVWRVGYGMRGGGAVLLNSGSIEVWLVEFSDSPGFGSQLIVDRRVGPTRWWPWSDRWMMSSLALSGWTGVLPLWIPLLLAAVPTVWLWRLDRGRAQPGRCAACGYDLAGLTRGAPCPECGKAASGKGLTTENTGATEIG